MNSCSAYIVATLSIDITVHSCTVYRYVNWAAFLVRKLYAGHCHSSDPKITRRNIVRYSACVRCHWHILLIGEGRQASARRKIAENRIGYGQRTERSPIRATRPYLPLCRQPPRLMRPSLLNLCLQSRRAGCVNYRPSLRWPETIIVVRPDPSLVFPSDPPEPHEPAPWARWIPAITHGRRSGRAVGSGILMSRSSSIPRSRRHTKGAGAAASRSPRTSPSRYREPNMRSR